MSCVTGFAAGATLDHVDWTKEVNLQQWFCHCALHFQIHWRLSWKTPCTQHVDLFLSWFWSTSLIPWGNVPLWGSQGPPVIEPEEPQINQLTLRCVDDALHQLLHSCLCANLHAASVNSFNTSLSERWYLYNQHHQLFLRLQFSCKSADWTLELSLLLLCQQKWQCFHLD